MTPTLNNQEAYEQFCKYLQEWARATTGKYFNHFGKFLTFTKEFKLPFTITTNQLARFKNENKQGYAGMITQIVFRISSISSILYCPKRSSVTIPIQDLSQLYFELQPRDGTQFIIENGILVKKDLTSEERENNVGLRTK